MLHTEYVRSLNCNYERILLDKKPEEKRYQYCILNRGGIKGLLPCSLRYINGLAYLYYDISSQQNVSQLYNGRCITRKWMSDFMWSFRQAQQELSRFLLDIGNVLWYPEQIFQDLESNIFSFIYVPYYEGEESFMKLIEYWVEHIDYDDDVLVDCVYHMYEQLERNGAVYLQDRIFEDVKCLEERKEDEILNLSSEGIHLTDEEAKNAAKEESENWSDSSKNLFHNSKNSANNHKMQSDDNKNPSNDRKNQSGDNKNEQDNGKNQIDSKILQDSSKVGIGNHMSQMETKTKIDNMTFAEKNEKEDKTEKKGIFSIFESKKSRSKKLREDYSMAMQQVMSGYTVAEDVAYYAEDYGRTVFMEEKQEDMGKMHSLYTPEGRLLANIEKSIMSIGKKKEEVDLVLEDTSVSRIHARITDDKGDIYLEDLNSTNGTFKNGLRMQPYEKRKLETGDEIKCGKVIFIFR